MRVSLVSKIARCSSEYLLPAPSYLPSDLYVYLHILSSSNPTNPFHIPDRLLPILIPIINLVTSSPPRVHSYTCTKLMKLCLHSPVPKAVNLQLKRQPRALNYHLECEIQVVEFYTACGGEAGEKTLGHGAEIGGQRAYIHEFARECGGWVAIGVGGDEVV